jgi:branched-chain amino acid transport system ATP-binding protein
LRLIWGKDEETEVLKISKLQAGYSGKEVLRGIDLTVEAGEIVALIGPNGSGKSTVLKSIFNQADIYGGRISLADRDITKQPTYALIKQGVSYVPQGRLVFSEMTVEENLQMGLFALESAAPERIEEIYQRYPMLRAKKNQLASVLSGGQQQILALARALIQEPKLLLLDEPSLGLAPKTMQEILAEIVAINKKGVAVLMVEQNAAQVVEMADRTYVLENGQIVLSGDKKIMSDRRLREVYFGGN